MCSIEKEYVDIAPVDTEHVRFFFLLLSSSSFSQVALLHLKSINGTKAQPESRQSSGSGSGVHYDLGKHANVIAFSYVCTNYERKWINLGSGWYFAVGVPLSDKYFFFIPL